MGFLELSWEPLGASWGDLGSAWGEIGWSRGDFSGTYILTFLIIFWSNFGRKKGAEREAFGEPKRNKNQSTIEVQI